MTGVSNRFATAQAGIALLGAAIVVALVGAAMPAEAAQRRGVIIVKKRISLAFPGPGRYAGKVKLLPNEKLAKNAKNSAGKRAGKEAKFKATNRAFKICQSKLRTTVVQVVHLSTPPFLIGVDKPEGGGEYLVTGPAPPVGDRVRASQNAATGKFSLFGFKWEVWCRRAQVVKAYG